MSSPTWRFKLQALLSWVTDFIAKNLHLYLPRNTIFCLFSAQISLRLGSRVTQLGEQPRNIRLKGEFAISAQVFFTSCCSTSLLGLTPTDRIVQVLPCSELKPPKMEWYALPSVRYLKRFCLWTASTLVQDKILSQCSKSARE